MLLYNDIILPNYCSLNFVFEPSSKVFNYSSHPLKPGGTSIVSGWPRVKCNTILPGSPNIITASDSDGSPELSQLESRKLRGFRNLANLAVNWDCTGIAGRVPRVFLGAWVSVSQ